MVRAVQGAGGCHNADGQPVLGGQGNEIDLLPFESANLG